MKTVVVSVLTALLAVLAIEGANFAVAPLTLGGIAKEAYVRREVVSDLKAAYDENGIKGLEAACKSSLERSGFYYACSVGRGATISNQEGDTAYELVWLRRHASRFDASADVEGIDTWDDVSDYPYGNGLVGFAHKSVSVPYIASVEYKFGVRPLKN